MGDIKLRLHDGVELTLRKYAQHMGVTAEEMIRCVIVPQWLTMHGVIPNPPDEQEQRDGVLKRFVDAIPHKPDDST